MMCTFRAVSEADASCLASLHARSVTNPWRSEEMRQLIEKDNILSFLVVHEGVEAGFVMLSLAADEAEIVMLAILPCKRRLGLGRALLDHAFVAAKTLKAQKLLLEVAEDNTPARELYANLGFNEIGRRIGYYARDPSPVDALILAKPLTHEEDE